MLCAKLKVMIPQTRSLHRSWHPLFTAVLTLTSQMSVERNKYKEVSVDIYLSQKGWHGLKDRMLVWMSTQNNAFTMLPKCAGSVTKGNVDALGLRAPNPADGGDPSDVPEPYVWRTLRAKLGAGATTVSVCAALQTGAGAEALYLDNVALHEQSTAGTCSPLGRDVLGFTRGASGNGACKPPRAARTLCGFENSEARDTVCSAFICELASVGRVWGWGRGWGISASDT